MKKLVLMLIVMIGVTTVSCKKKELEFENEVNEYSKKYEYLDARSYTEWVYFSFSQNAIVTISNPETSLDWDIAFHRGDVKLNGGASGVGSGAAIKTTSKNWDEITNAPTSGYVNDSIGKIVTSFTGSGVTEEDQPFSQTVSTWLTIDISNPPPVYIVNNWVYVVKNANGNYVKLQMYDNKNATGSSGYISFKYQVCNDGETIFK